MLDTGKGKVSLCMYLQEGVGDVAMAAAGAKHPHAAPTRRPSNLHLKSKSMAGDLHTSEHNKKDGKEVTPTQYTAPQASCFVE